MRLGMSVGMAVARWPRLVTSSVRVRRTVAMLMAMRDDFLILDGRAKTSLHRRDALHRHGDDQDDGQQNAKNAKHAGIVPTIRRASKGTDHIKR